MDIVSLIVGLVSGLAIGIVVEEWRRWRNSLHMPEERRRQEALSGLAWAEELVISLHQLLDYLDGLKMGLPSAAANILGERAVTRVLPLLERAEMETMKLDRLGDEQLSSLLIRLTHESKRIGLGEANVMPGQLAQSLSDEDLDGIRTILNQMAGRILDLKI